MCVAVFGRVSSKKSFHKGSFDDDDCTGALGSDCVNDLLSAAMEDNIPCNMELPTSCTNVDASNGVFDAGMYIRQSSLSCSSIFPQTYLLTLYLHRFSSYRDAKIRKFQV